MTEIITSLSLSDLIASLALLVALASFSYTRRAIKASLKPNLVLEHDFRSPEKMHIRVRNDGIGPARIIKVKVSFKKVFKEHNHDTGWKYVTYQRKPLGVEFDNYVLKPGDTIISGKEISLIKLSTSGVLGKIEKEVKNFLLFASDLKFEIEYESYDKGTQESVTWDGPKKNLFGKF